MSGVYFYTIGVAFTIGIFLRSFVSVGVYDCAFLLVLLGAVLCIFRMRGSVVPQSVIIGSAALVAGVLGVLRLDYAEMSTSAFSPLVGEEVTFSGVVVREPDVRERLVHLYVRSDESSELLLVTTDRFVEFSYGDRVVVDGEITAPQSFETDLGRVFDYAGYLRARGVSYMVPFAEVSVVESGTGNTFIAALLDAKVRVMEAIEHALPEPHAGLGEGVLLGVKRAIGTELEDIFRTTGIIHIVVLSGYNLMVVAEFTMWALSFFFGRRARLFVGIGVILSFALMVGLSATVVRASIMAMLVLIARATGRTYAIMRALLVAGVAMLIHNPYLLVHDPGFQLSFLATLGLIFLAPKIEERLYQVSARFDIRDFLTATLAAQIMVLPLLLYLMGEFSLVSVIVNVLVLPLVPLAMLLTCMTGVVGIVSSTLGTVVGFSAYAVLGYIIAIPTFFAQLPFAALAVPTFPFWAVVLMYAFLSCGIYRWSKQSAHVAGENTQQTSDEFDAWVIEEEIEKPPKLPF